MRKLIVSIIFCISILVLPFSSSAGDRSVRLKPKWVTHALPESKSGTYFFVSTYGEGTSIEAARKSTFINLSSKLEDEHGLVINTKFHSMTRNITTTDGSKGSRETEIEIVAEERGKQIKITCREIDEYWECRDERYEMHVLYAVSNGMSPDGSYVDDIKVTAKYPGAGFLSLIPSAGQFYKGDNLKGGIILGAEILAAGGVLLCENTRSSYVKKMYEQPKYAAEYNSLADTWETGRNICIGAAAAIYVYNLIDAFTAKGARRVVVKRGRTSLQAAPYIDQRSFGMGLTYKF